MCHVIWKNLASARVRPPITENILKKCRKRNHVFTQMTKDQRQLSDKPFLSCNVLGVRSRVNHDRIGGTSHPTPPHTILSCLLPRMILSRCTYIHVSPRFGAPGVTMPSLFRAKMETVLNDFITSFLKQSLLGCPLASNFLYRLLLFLTVTYWMASFLLKKGRNISHEFLIEEEFFFFF